MLINRIWAMPNSRTFSIKPIAALIEKYKTGFTIDPFARDCKIADVTNDLDPETSAEFHMDYMDFLKRLLMKALTVSCLTNLIHYAKCQNATRKCAAFVQ